MVAGEEIKNFGKEFLKRMFGINFLGRFKKKQSNYEITECFTDAELEQYQNNGGNFFTAVQRCSYDDWRQNSSLTTYEEYEQEHLPDNLLDYCARLLPELESTIKGELSSDFPFIALLIGDKYREWLGDRKNTKETHTTYSKEMLAFADLSAEDFNKELHGTGLNISTWYYLLPINAVPKGKVFDGRIDKNIAAKFEKYLCSIVNNLDDEDDIPRFSVYVAPYIVRGELAENDLHKYKTLAFSKWDDGKVVNYSDTDEVDSSPVSRCLQLIKDGKSTVYGIPVVVREEHFNGILTAGEIKEYYVLNNTQRKKQAMIDLETIGRHLARVSLGESGIEYLLNINYSSIVGRLKSDIAGRFDKKYGLEIHNQLIPVSDFAREFGI